MLSHLLFVIMGMGKNQLFIIIYIVPNMLLNALLYRHVAQNYVIIIRDSWVNLSWIVWY
jgi:hypothetical protein